MPFSRRQWILSGLLTAGCLGAYFGLRSVPVKACELLHYGDYLGTDGVIEGCGFEESGFFDLDELRFPVLARVTPLAEVTAGRAATFELTLATSTGRQISAGDIAISHTERVHAMVVDPSLSDYQHLHPQPTGAPGTFVFTVTPHRAGTYRVYLDFIPLQTARRTLVVATFEVPGEGLPAVVAESRVARTTDDLEVVLVPDPGHPMRAGADIPFKLEVRSPGAHGPLVFDPVMDSYAHLVAFAPGRNGFAHFHPRNPFLDSQDPAAPDLEFLFRVEEPGAYRVWAQFSVNGQEHFVPFDLQIPAAG